MTDQDLREARAAVDEAVGREHRGARRRWVALAAAAAVVLAAVGVTAALSMGGDDDPARLAGPGQDTPDPYADHLTGSAPTPALLDGVWRLDNGDTALRFDEKGTVQFDGRGTLYSRPGTTASYVIAGDLITMTITDDERPECVGTSFAMRASFPEPGAMRFVRTDTSSTCAPLPSSAQALEQVLPAGPGIVGLAFSMDTGWMALTDKAVLHGVWWSEGGGHVLEMDAGGAYVVADGTGDPVDRGQWSLRGSELTLTSAASSAACSAGDRVVLGSVAWLQSGTTVFRGAVKQNTCGGAWTPAAWLLVPNTIS